MNSAKQFVPGQLWCGLFMVVLRTLSWVVLFLLSFLGMPRVDTASHEDGWNMRSGKTACFWCPENNYIDLNSFSLCGDCCHYLTAESSIC